MCVSVKGTPNLSNLNPTTQPKPNNAVKQGANTPLQISDK